MRLLLADERVIGIPRREHVSDGVLRGDVGVGHQVANALVPYLKAAPPSAQLLAAGASGCLTRIEPVIEIVVTHSCSLEEVSGKSGPAQRVH
jgi:hypothetical protein